ncbi:MAG: cytosine permease, partial [Candidatus Bathyarchaeota archaeon]|nr:cytosine permease [Candidatus Bathyarchaeota archaeon]
TFWVGLDLVVAMPVSWLPLVADYTRFSKTTKHCFWGLYLGHFLGCGLCYILGALTNVAVHRPDPISIIAVYGLGFPAMLIIIFSTTTTAFLDIYSAAVSFKNVFTKINVKKQIIIVGVIGTIIAVFFPPEQYEWFLLLVGGAFTSLAGIMLSDYFALKRHYDSWGLVKVDKRYWYSYGVNLTAVIVWLAGFLFYLLVAAVALLGVSIPILEVVAFNLGSSLPTFILVFMLYTILVRCIRVGGT